MGRFLVGRPCYWCLYVLPCLGMIVAIVCMICWLLCMDATQIWNDLRHGLLQELVIWLCYRCMVYALWLKDETYDCYEGACMTVVLDGRQYCTELLGLKQMLFGCIIIVCMWRLLTVTCYKTYDACLHRLGIVNESMMWMLGWFIGLSPCALFCQVNHVCYALHGFGLYKCDIN